MLKEFYNSKNKIYFIIKNKGIISAFFAILTFVFGTYGYYQLHDSHGIREFLDAVFNSFALFGLNFPEIDQLSISTFIASVSAIITVALTAILFFFKDQINKKIFANISSREHLGIFGLGQIARTFLEDKELSNNVIIVNQNTTNADMYRSRGFGVRIGDALHDEVFLYNSLNFYKMKYALIAFGNDTTNIEFAKKIISLYEEQKIDTDIKLIVHINNKNFSMLFNKNFLLPNFESETKINIKTFSYYEEAARDLFEKYSLDGDTLKYMHSDESLITILLGNTELLKRVLYRIISLSHFPNQNKHIIYIVDKNATDLLEELKMYIYHTEQKYSTVSLVALNLDFNRDEFYENKVWKNQNLENIIVCYDDENINIEIATILHERVYFEDTVDKKKVPKIIIGVFQELKLSKSINLDICEYRNIFTFGSQRDLLTVEHLLNEKIDLIAKLIHYGYGAKYQPNKLIKTKEEKLKIEKKWFDSSLYDDKLSNIYQARHIKMKLKALGLDMQKVKMQKEELLRINKEIFKASFLESKSEEYEEESLIHISEELDNFWNNKPYAVKYWPENFDSSLFNKMVRMEHNRWITYHYLEGWKYGKKNKKKKIHNCLIPLEKFKENEMRITIIYDMYSFLYIPNYMAEIGCELIKYKEKV